MTTTRRFLECLAVAALAIAPARVAADPKKDAEEHLRKGIELFQAKRYSEALAEYNTGYAIDPQPELLFAKAQAQRMLGDCTRAIDNYRAYLDTNPPEAKAAKARRTLETCRATLAASTDTGKGSDSSKGIGTGSEHGSSEHGEHGGSEHGENGEHGEHGRSEHVQRPVPTTTHWWQDGKGVGLGVGGIVLLGASLGFTLSARDSAAQAGNADTISDWELSNSAWSRDRVIATISFGAGAVLTTVAIVRFARSGREHPAQVGTIKRAPRVTLDAHPTPTGGVVTLGGSW